LALICWMSNWCSIAVPINYEDLTKSFAVLVLGTLYSATPLREWSNRVYFDRVGTNLVEKLTRPFLHDPTFPHTLTWRKIKRVFYYYVDTDPSLKHLKQLVFWNGALWTSFADLRIISGGGAIVVALVMAGAYLWGDPGFNYARATYVYLLFIFLFVASIGLSEVFTKNHIRLGSQQAKIIVDNHQQDLKQRLIQASL
jgi:hypothetical protein